MPAAGQPWLALESHHPASAAPPALSGEVATPTNRVGRNGALRGFHQMFSVKDDFRVGGICNIGIYQMGYIVCKTPVS